MVDPIGAKTYVTVSLDQLQTLEQTGKTPTFATPEEAQEYESSLAAARQLGGDVLTIPKPTNFDDLGLVDLGLSKAYEDLDVNLTEIFSLLHEMGVEMRKAGKEARQATRESEQASLLAAADKIRSAAALAMAAGIVSGAMSIAGGLVSLGFTAKAGKELAGLKPKADGPDLPGSISQLKSELGASQATGRARANAVDSATLKDQIANMKAKLNAKPSLDPIELQMVTSKVQNLTTMGQAHGQIWQGVGAIASSALTYGSKMEEAAKAEIDAESSRLNYQVQDETEIINNLKEMIQDVRSKLAEIQQTQNQAASKIWS